MGNIKINDEQIDILEKLMDMEINGDDPCLDKKSKKAILKDMRTNHQLSGRLWYELMEMGGYRPRLTDKERAIIEPVYDSAEMTLADDAKAEKK